MRRLLVTGVLALFGTAIPVHGQLVPADSRSQVNSTLPGTPEYPDIAIAPSGQFVVVWTGQDGDSDGVFAQRFDSLGRKIGPEFRVNSSTAGAQRYPRIAMTGSGAFMIVWESFQIRGQLFEPSGSPVGPELTISDPGITNQRNVDVAADDGGNFVVAWQKVQFSPVFISHIVARRFDADTRSFDPEILVSAEPVYTDLMNPEVEMDGAGRFVVIWGRHDPSNNDSVLIYGRLFDATGQAIDGEFLVSPFDPLFPWDNVEFRLDMNSSGEFAVAWERQGDGIPERLLARAFDANGAPRTGAVLLDFGSGAGGLRSRPNLSMAGDGSFVATWNNPGVRAQRFSGTGSRLGSEAQVDTVASTYQVAPAIGMHDSGNLVIAWGSGQVYARRYLSLCAPPGVPELKHDLINDGVDMLFTWDDVVQAGQYVVFEDTLPGGSFSTQTGISSTGSTGLTIPVPTGDRFYLVAGSGACGLGPLR